MRIELQGITKRFGPVKALQSVSAHVSSGELLLLEGPNGSGKSTLLRILATAFSADEGQYLWDGKPVKSMLSAVRSRLGLLADAGGLYEDFTVEENLLFWARVYGTARDTVRDGQWKDCLSRWQLNWFTHRHVRTLSQGMRRRVALAKLSLANPDVLLLDEPFNGLDKQNAQTLLQMLSQWKSSGKAIVVATHQPELVSEITDKWLSLDNGMGTVRKCGDSIPIPPFQNSRDTSLIPNSDLNQSSRGK